MIPPYPYDRLEELRPLAERHAGGAVDLSVGTPTDPPPPCALEALTDEGGAARGYPPSAGTPALRRAIQDWVKDRLGAEVPLDSLAVCVGTKEYVATLPQWLKLRDPARDTVLYPAVAYPTYEMGARLAGLRPVPVRLDEKWHLDLGSVAAADAGRALMLWVNSPGNPAGGLDDLGEVAAWARGRDVPVFSDECYAEFTWEGPPRSVLTHGLDGVVAVHSLSKRSNMAGMRVGWYAGDAGLVAHLREVRKHAGLMVPGPVQRAAAAALGDQAHVEAQRARYIERLVRARAILAAAGVEAPLPAGGFYLWAPVPGGDDWAWARWMAEKAGVLVSPGSFYGAAGEGYVRLAMVAPLERLDLVAERLGV
ncbi:MAG: aminotransferase class I/II-fold pyridoxal phosphate-dependent enzyme [Acidimicrobiales bacterium]